MITPSIFSTLAPKTTLVLTMHNEVEQAIRCILSYFEKFKNFNVILNGDLDLERETVARYFNIASHRSPSTVSKLHLIERRNFDVPKHEIADITINLFKSIFQSCKLIDTEFVIFLHPDHFIRRNFSKKIGKYSMEIARTNPYPQNYLDQFEVITKTKVSLKYYGLASYFNREALLAVLEYLEFENYKLIHSLVEINNRFVYDDSLMPLLFEYMGFKVGYQNITFEAGRKHRISHYFRPHELMHQTPNEHKIT